MACSALDSLYNSIYTPDLSAKQQTTDHYSLQRSLPDSFSIKCFGSFNSSLFSSYFSNVIVHLFKVQMNSLTHTQVSSPRHLARIQLSRGSWYRICCLPLLLIATRLTNVRHSFLERTQWERNLFCLLQRVLQHTDQFFVANKLELWLKGMQNRMKISWTLTKSN